MTKNAGSQDVTKRRIMTKFSIDEISAVDRPAQEGARAMIMKRDTPLTEKRGVDFVDMLTGETDGHQHGIRFVSGDGDGGLGMVVQYSAGPNEDMETHDHQIVQNSDGVFEMGVNHGHTHNLDMDEIRASALLFMTKNDGTGQTTWIEGGELAALTKTANENAGSVGEVVTKGDTQMSDDNKAELEAMTKRAERAETIAKMSGDVRKHFDALTEADQNVFLELTSAEQIADIAKAAEGNAVVFKSADGTEFTKSDDPRLVQMAKDRDADREELAVSKAAIAKAGLTKRAEALVHIPGDVETRVEMLKAIDGIADVEKRDAALEALKAQDLALGEAFKAAGTSETPISGSTETEELDALAKTYAEEHNVSEAVAYGEVLKTAKGSALYAKSVQ